MIPLGNLQAGVSRTARTYVAFTTAQSTICAATTGGGTVYFGTDAKWYANSNPRDFTPAPTGYYRSMSAWTYDWMYLVNGEMLDWGEYGSCPPVVSYISISPASISLPQGLTQQLQVTAHYNNGSTQNVTSQCSYNSDNAARAEVTQNGLIIANNQNGSVQVWANFEDHSDYCSVTVTAAVVSSISATPNPFNVQVGNTQQITVTAHMSNGSNQNVTSSSSFTRTNTNISVSAGGLITGSVQGSSGVNISYSGASTSISGTVAAAPVVLTSITVSPTSFSIPQGSTQQLTVTAHYSDSSTQNVTSMASYSVNTRFSVSSGGLVTANTGVGVGTSVITISYSGQSTSSSATATAVVPTVTSVSVSPTSFNINVGATQQLTVTAHMSDSTTQNVTSSASYTANNGNVTVGSNGLVTGVSAGNSIVTASYSGFTSTSNATIQAPVPKIISLVSEPVSIENDVSIVLYNGGVAESVAIRAYYDNSSSRLLNRNEYSTPAHVSGHTLTATAAGDNSSYLYYAPSGVFGPSAYYVNYTGSDPSDAPSCFIYFVIF